MLSSLDYGNGDKVQYTYDKQGQVTAQTYEDGDTVTYRYDNDGELALVTDSATGLSTKYIYDFTGRTAAVERRNGDTIILRTEQSHNSDDQPIRRTTKFANGANYTYSYTYNADMTPQGMVSGVVGTGFVYDALMRISRVNSEIGVLTRTYGYSTDPHTSQVTALNYENLKSGYSFKYTYDAMGNIASYHLDCVNNGYDEAAFTYEYDSQNQLVKATDGTVTYSYTYDNAGNISTANGHTYTYGNSDWGDLLTAYDGQSITYDEIGNPTSYYNGTRWTFTWEHGRQLAAASGGGNNVTYTYDADGLRTSKTVNGVVYTYYYVGSQLARMTYGDYVLDFFYDINGTPIAMRQGYASSNNYTVYYYITNLQGDVIRLVDVNGSTAAYYEYDPYGNAIQAAGSHANINPLRYRGYVYDSETQLYYLQSRYYDPKIGRFLNADALVSTGQGILGNNMFAYCNNNSVTYADPEGNLPGSIINPNAMALDSGCSLRPIPDKERQDTYTELGNQIGTLFIGRTITASYGAGGSVTIGVAVDRYWNVGLIVTPSAGGGFPAIGTARVWGVTNAPTIYDLSGWSGQVGGSINAYGGSVGIETSFFANPQNGESYQGWAFMLGSKASLPVEVHGTIGYTFVFGGNLFDILINSSNAISFQ